MARTGQIPVPASTPAEPSVATTALPAPERLYSLDQFRGYAVAAMFVVNFCGNLQAIPDWIKHHDNFFSYADSIAPAFLFAAGFSFRLTMLRRIPRNGTAAAYGHAVWRGLALVAVSLTMYGFNNSFVRYWENVDREQVWNFIAGMIKANLWETLAIIGVSQSLVLPFVAKRTWIIIVAMISLLVGHMLLSYSFNFAFIYAQPNWLDAYWGAVKQTAWDGGFFGLMMWGAIMLGGAWAHDLVVGFRPVRGAAHLILCGSMVMAIAYGLSCLSTVYDVPPETPANERDLAASPVFPTREQLQTSQLRLVEPPFVAPPPRSLKDLEKLQEAGKAPLPPRLRPLNYWMMSTRIMTLTFTLFSIGFSMACLASFVLLTDLIRLQIGIFRTFGTNALAAYFIHHSMEVSVHGIVPKDSPLWWCLVGLAIFFVMTYLFIRFLEKQRIFIRL